jgi:hypothetical protein
MALPASLNSLIHDNLELLLLFLFALVILLILGLIITASRLSKLTRLYNRLTRGTSGGNIEENLLVYMDTVAKVDTLTQALDNRLEKLAAVQRTCLQRVGMVRFDAFEDVGGEQSFAVVILDAEKNGVAVSSVYSRTDVRIYAKAINSGKPSHPLTKEEQRAMAQAEAV